MQYWMTTTRQHDYPNRLLGVSSLSIAVLAGAENHAGVNNTKNPASDPASDPDMKITPGNREEGSVL
jgi:hypothetical protein